MFEISPSGSVWGSADRVWFRLIRMATPNKGPLMGSFFSLCPHQCSCGTFPWNSKSCNSLESHEGSCFESGVRVVVKSRSSFIIVMDVVAIVVLTSTSHLSVARCHGKHKRYLRTNGQNTLWTDARKTVCQSTKSRQSKQTGENGDDDDDDDDDGVVSALHAAVNEE